MKLTIEELNGKQITAVAFAVDNPDVVIQLANSVEAVASSAMIGDIKLEVSVEATGPSNTPVAEGLLGDMENVTGALTEPTPSAEDIFGAKQSPTPVATAEPTGVAQGVQPHTTAPTTGVDAVSTVATASPSDVDAAGMPWDDRIHTANKSTVKAGTWKYKPKTDKAFIAQIEQGYREQGYGVPTAEPAPQESAPTISPGIQPTAPTQAAPQVVDPGVTFPMIVAQITMGISANKFTSADISGVLTKYGLSSSGELAAREDLLQPVWNDIEALSNA